jgi:hypothetical protein
VRPSSNGNFAATMAPAALSAPVLRVSPQSAGRDAAVALAGGLRFGKTARLHSVHSGIFTTAPCSMLFSCANDL